MNAKWNDEWPICVCAFYYKQRSLVYRLQHNWKIENTIERVGPFYGVACVCLLESGQRYDIYQYTYREILKDFF